MLPALLLCASAHAQVRAFYQVWDRPLITVSGAHVISKAMRRCGGANVLAGLPGIAPEIDRETVLRADPEAIAASGPDRNRPTWLGLCRILDDVCRQRMRKSSALRPDVAETRGPRQAPRDFSTAPAPCQETHSQPPLPS